MTVQQDNQQRLAALSPESRHGVALNQLQGFEPSGEFLEVLELLDSGEIDDDDAIERAAAIAARG